MTHQICLINYPEIVANLWETIKSTDWNIHQWINWVYPIMLVIVKRDLHKKVEQYCGYKR